MPIDASPSGTLDIENATLRSREIVALTNMVAGNDVVRSLNPPTLEIYGDPEPTLELVSNVNDVSASAFARLTSNAGVFSIQSGVNQEIDSKGDIAFTSINGNSEHMRIVGSTGRIGIGTTNPTSNLHVMGDINLEHVSNVATLKVNSNVVTEFPRSKKLIKYPRVALTSAAETGSGYEGYIVTRSSQFSNYNAWEAFDENNPVGGNTGAGHGWASTIPGTYSVSTGAETGTVQHHSGSVQGEWIQIQLPESIYLHDFVIESRSETTYGADGYDHGYPKSVVLYGSINGSSWVEIRQFTTGLKTFSEAHTENINETTHVYKYFALVVNTTQVVNNTTQVSHTAIGQIRLFGTPEYDPEADGVDVVVKSVPNVPNTDWLEVYYDAKDLADGALSTTSGAITGLGGTTINGTAFGDPQVSNGAFVFDGSGDYIRGQLTSFGGEQTFTFSLWFNMVEMVSGSNNSIFQIGSQGSGEEGLGFRVQTGSVFRMYTWGGPSNFDVGTVLPNTWYHAVGTYSGGVMTLYVDGNVLQSTSGSSLDLPTNPYFALGVQLTSSGTEYSTSGFNGSIANFRLFNRALTTDEIYQLYAYQKEYFGHGDLGMTLKAGRLGIGTSEPKAALDVRGDVLINGYQLTSMYPGFASGGDDIYDVDGYRNHVFTNSGTFTVPGKNIHADVLVVGGGGGGGQDNAGGGGAGGLIFKPGHTFAGRGASGGRDGYYVITIGSGGIGNKDQNSTVATAGNDTVIRPGRDPTDQSVSYDTDYPAAIFIAKGGGPGDESADIRPTSMDGGSGGGGQNSEGKGEPHTGGTQTQTAQSGDSGTYGYGNNGGTGVDDGGGGGGGAGAAGQDGDVLFDGAGGNGGNGLSAVNGYDFAEIFGTRYGEVVDEDVYFAGGGAGGNRNNIYSSYASGGRGGGGSSGGTPQTNENGLPGTGGGGAGSLWSTTVPNYQANLYGGDGGSGIVIIRYRL